MANSVERYYQKKKKRKKRAKMVFFTLLFILMLLTLAILSVTVFFNAEEITVEGNERYTAKELLEAGNLKVGQNLFRMDKFEVIDQMKELPYVKDVTIKRKLPGGLRITVTENEPVVWIPHQSGAALLNEEYRVLELVSLPAESEEAAEENPLQGIPQLVGPAATYVEVGKTVEFGETDYTGFLARLFEGVMENADLNWEEVPEVQFIARYDIKMRYHQSIVIDFGTLDRVETKLQLAAYLLKDNGLTQAATVDVSDPERVYYRPKK